MPKERKVSIPVELDQDTRLVREAPKFHLRPLSFLQYEIENWVSWRRASAGEIQEKLKSKLDTITKKTFSDIYLSGSQESYILKDMVKFMPFTLAKGISIYNEIRRQVNDVVLVGNEIFKGGFTLDSVSKQPFSGPNIYISTDGFYGSARTFSTRTMRKGLNTVVDGALNQIDRAKKGLKRERSYVESLINNYQTARKTKDPVKIMDAISDLHTGLQEGAYVSGEVTLSYDVPDALSYIAAMHSFASQMLEMPDLYENDDSVLRLLVNMQALTEDYVGLLESSRLPASLLKETDIPSEKPYINLVLGEEITPSYVPNQIISLNQE